MTTREFYFILTVQRPVGSSGFATYTTASTVDLSPGATRGGLLTWVREQLPKEWRDGSYNIVFFSAEPNELVPDEPATGHGSAA